MKAFILKEMFNSKAQLRHMQNKAIEQGMQKQGSLC